MAVIDTAGAGQTGLTDMAAYLERARYRGPHTPWDAVIGHGQAKRELRMVAASYRRQAVAERLGIGFVKGLALLGEPGVGKSMLARALASEIDREMYLFPSAEMDPQSIRQIYEALADVPSVLVWDEADVLLQGRARMTDRESNRMVAAFCAALDGIDPISGPITIALTAQGEWSLDRSVMRAGRITTKVTLSPPDLAERRQLWEMYVAHVVTTGDIDLDAAAEQSSGMTGADIEACVLAGLGLAFVEGVDALDQAHLNEAIFRDHHVDGRKQRAPVDTESVARHEAGHVLYACLVFGVDSIESVTLQRRRLNEGRTRLRESFRDLAAVDVATLRDLVGMAFAGSVAEDIVRGPVASSLGSGSDYRRATSILRMLLVEYGQSRDIGPLAIDQLEGDQESRHRGSGVMRDLLFHAMRRAAVSSYERTRTIVSSRGHLIPAIAEQLVLAPGMSLSGEPLRRVLVEVVGNDLPSQAERDDWRVTGLVNP